MASTSQRTVRNLNRRQRRQWYGALLASLLFHVLLVLAFRESRPPPSALAAAGPRAGDDRAAPGGGMRAIAFRVPLPPSPPPPIPRPPEPIPTPEVTIQPVPLEQQPQPPAALPSEGTGALAPGRGRNVGPGLEGGTGRGDGGTAAQGRFRQIPPSPRSLILPPTNCPGKVHGKAVDVWVLVTNRGVVVPDSIRVSPSTGDTGCDDRLRAQAAEWVFEPARRAGRPVAQWFRYTASF